MKRSSSVILGIFIPLILWAHAGPADRYLAAVPSYRALTEIPEYIFIIAHGLLIVGAIIYAVVRKYRGTIALSILPAYNHLNESLKLLISTLLLSIGITPVLYVSGSFYGMMFFVAAFVSFIFFVLLFIRKFRGFFISSFYTLFVSAIVVLQVFYYAVYYAFQIWKSDLFQNLFKLVDFEEPFPPITYYPDHAIPFLDLLENIACIAVLFLLAYGFYLLISYLFRLLGRIIVRPHGVDRVNAVKEFLGFDWGKSAKIFNEYYHIDGYSEILIHIEDEKEWDKLKGYCQSQKDDEVSKSEDGEECYIIISHNRGTYEAIFKTCGGNQLPVRSRVKEDFYYERHYPNHDPYGYVIRVDYSLRMIVFTTESV